MNPTPNMTLREFVERFYIVERPVGKSATNQLRDMVRVLSAFAGRELTLGELDENLASRWIASLERTYAAETCRSKQRALLCVWRYAADLDAASEPRKRRIRKVRKPSPLVQCWTVDEVSRLIEAVPAAVGYDRYASKRVPQSRRWYDRVVVDWQYRGIDPVKFWQAFIRVALDSGLRLGDVLSIRREWIDADGILVVQQQKTGNPIVCRLTPETMEAVAATFPPDRELLFPWAENWKQKFHKRFREIVREAGIRVGTTKWLRRTRASYAERETPGMARRVLGHTSSDTWKRYVDVRIGMAPPPPAPRIDAKLPEPTVTPDAWTAEDIGRLLDATLLDRFDADTQGVHRGQFLAALVHVVMDTGLIVEKALELRWSDAKPDGRIAMPSDGSGFVTLTELQPATWAAVELVRQDGDDRLLPWYAERGELRRRLREAMAAIDLVSPASCPFYQLHRTALSHFAESTAGPKQIEGPKNDVA